MERAPNKQLAPRGGLEVKRDFVFVSILISLREMHGRKTEKNWCGVERRVNERPELISG